MTEIKLTLDDPAKTVDLLKTAARYASSDGWNHASAQHAHWLATKIADATEEPLPLAEWETELLNLRYRRDTAVAVLEAMDVDQYLIDAVRDASPLSDDGAAAPPADYQGAPTPSAAERATPTAAPSSVTYPHLSGDVIVLGPETFKAADDSVICHKGENYYPTSVVITSSETTVNPAQAYRNGHARGESHLRSVLVEKITRLQTLAVTGPEKEVLRKALVAVKAEL